jgi:hypothetical protein
MKDPKMLYKGLPKEMGTTWRNEAIDKYGKDTISKSEQSLLKMGKQEFTDLIKEQKRVNKALFDLRKMDPQEKTVQDLIADHYKIIRKFWGTYETKDMQKEAYIGLGELYISDERYTKMDGIPHPEFAEFLQKAMAFYANLMLK